MCQQYQVPKTTFTLFFQYYEYIMYLSMESTYFFKEIICKKFPLVCFLMITLNLFHTDK